MVRAQESAAGSSKNVLQYDFAQTHGTVNVSVPIVIHPDGASVQITSSGISVHSDSGILLELKPLLYPIDAEQSRYNITSNTLELTLVKRTAGTTWETLLDDKEYDQTITGRGRSSSRATDFAPKAAEAAKDKEKS